VLGIIEIYFKALAPEISFRDASKMCLYRMQEKSVCPKERNLGPGGKQGCQIFWYNIDYKYLRFWGVIISLAFVLRHCWADSINNETWIIGNV
jgi:hypothetical protein